jgi:hypothetical protein
VGKLLELEVEALVVHAVRNVPKAAQEPSHAERGDDGRLSVIGPVHFEDDQRGGEDVAASFERAHDGSVEPTLLLDPLSFGERLRDLATYPTPRRSVPALRQHGLQHTLNPEPGVLPAGRRAFAARM